MIILPLDGPISSSNGSGDSTRRADDLSSSTGESTRRADDISSSTRDSNRRANDLSSSTGDDSSTRGHDEYNILTFATMPVAVAYDPLEQLVNMASCFRVRNLDIELEINSLFLTNMCECSAACQIIHSLRK